MKFAIGFLVGLLTGVTIVLAPLVVIFMSQKDEDDKTITGNAVEEKPEYKRGMPS